MRENIKIICREYGGNVSVQKCLRFGCGKNDFPGTGDNEENTSRILGKCARAMVPAFWMRGARFRGHGTQ